MHCKKGDGERRVGLGWGPGGQWGSATQRKTVGTVDSIGVSVAGDNNSSGARRGDLLLLTHREGALRKLASHWWVEDAVITYLPWQSVHCRKS